MKPLEDYIKRQLDSHLLRIEEILDVDVLTINSPLYSPLESRIRSLLEKLDHRHENIGIIIETNGGLVEVAERIVDTIRNHYEEVYFLVPNKAMSAGTVLVMSGERIFMDYFSCLGPIDPQILVEGRYIPALSYLNQFERLVKKSERGELTTAEFALLHKFDLGELYQFEQARELSIELLEKWLSSYKFKNWEVTTDKKESRANQIGKQLSNVKRWHTHGRGINMETLRKELGLKIDDFSSVKNLSEEIKNYFELFQDYIDREEYILLLHTREEFYGYQISPRSTP